LILSKVLEYRQENCGSRLQKVMASGGICFDIGRIDWRLAGAFQVVSSDGIIVASVKHISGATVSR
jgi:hypothetical protein